MKLRSLFSQNELKLIEAKVHEAEKQTSGEIVVLVVPSSGQYLWVRWMWGAMGAAVGSILVWFVTRQGYWTLSFSQILEAQLAAALLFSVFPIWRPLKRLTLSKSLIAERVHRECLANFTALGLHETRARTGILVYISELEHRVEILADRGIHQKVGHDYWKTQVGHIVSGIRTGKPAEAVGDVVTEIGRKLAEFFPRQDDDTNELANDVRLGHQDHD